MKKILSALFALVSATAASALPFQNGSFESGALQPSPCNDALPIMDSSITGWTVIAGNIEYLDAGCWTASNGARSIDLVGSGPGRIGGIQQTFDTVPGNTYRVTFDLAGNPSVGFPPALKNLRVTVDGTPRNYVFDTTGKSTAAMGWTPHSFLFVAGMGGTSTISFVSDQGPPPGLLPTDPPWNNPAYGTFAGAALDNVQVQNVTPLPANAWIGGGGTVLSGILPGYPGGPYPQNLATPVVCSGAGANWSPFGGSFQFPLTDTSDGTTGPVVASYEVPIHANQGACGTWSMTTMATSTGTVDVTWNYHGNHSSFQTTADLQAFVFRPGTGIVQSSSLVSVAGPTYILPLNKFQFSGPYTFNVQTNDVYGFNITGSNFDFIDAMSGTLTVTLLAPPPPVVTAPVLIRALPTGSAVIPPLIGRVDGLPNTLATVRLLRGDSCTNGVLSGNVAQVGSDVNVTTDAANPITGYPGGYFGTSQGGTQGQFVAIQLINPQLSPVSNCVVTAANNDTWPKALTLNANSPAVPDWIDVAGKARWYKFSVLPGQSVQVTISGLPADYDLAVFKDLAVEFANELVPATTAELTRLSAQYAPSAFSPSAFSPSAFSPSAFSPSAFSPSAFSPSAFSPSAFSPSAFSPSAFSPSAFSPSAFSPSAFSPSAFSPSAFSPSAFSPSAFSPSAFSADELSKAFAAAQTRSIIAASMTPGTGNESVLVNTWNNTGNFYARVTGRSGAFSTSSYNIAFTKQGTSCNAVTDTTISTRVAVPNSYSTIVLVDSSKTSLSEALPGGVTLASKLAAFVLRPDVNGVIVDVNTAPYSRVGTLKTQANNNVGCPFAKNLVALEIRSIVDAYRTPNLRYVVILGNDDAIPFFRYPDQTLLGQESGFVPPVNSNSASEASLRGNFVLSQDAYGATNSISLRVSEFPIPGMAVGRLIETPAEIAGMIDAYTIAGGSISPSSSLVTGYDFLADVASAVSTEFGCGTGASGDVMACGPLAQLISGRFVDSLITPNDVSPADPRTFALGGPWTATDLRNKVLNTRHDVMFLAGHFNANSALGADFKTSFLTSELATANLTNALVFSAGCHAGYNLVDADVINGVTFPLDWAQAFAQKGATLVAGTGYQYGDTEFLEYSERLYLNFAKELRAGTGNVAIGEALVKAKRAYLAATQDVRGLHEKAVLEATLFGLPMFSVNMPAGRGGGSTVNGVIDAQPPVVPSLATTALGLRLADYPAFSPALTSNTLNLTNYDLPLPNSTAATWYSGSDGVVTNPAEPALPLQVVNVTPIDSNQVLRGVGFRGASYSDSTVLPLTGAPTTELRGVHLPFSSPVFFPMRLWTPNYFSGLAGVTGTNLLVTPAQHRTVEGTNNSTFRQYSNLALRLFYSDLTVVATANKAAFLSDAPTIVRAEAAVNAGTTTFSAQVVGDPAAAIHKVWITYTNGAGGSGSWISVDLEQCVTPLPAACGTMEDSQFWKAQVATGTLPADTRYVAQAVSGTGLVSLDDNLGRYYSIAAGAPVATVISVGAAVPASVGYGNSVTVTATLSAGVSPLAGKVVTIAAGGGAQTGTTIANGSVTVQLPMPSTPGTYPLSASFGGDTAYLPSSASAPSAVTVTKAAATLTPPSSGVGAVLKAGTQPLAQESIKFLILGPQGVLQVFVITDYTGRATIPPPGLPPGTYSVIQACFAGNATYTDAKLNANPACGYTFAGFYQPVDSLPTLNSVKAGSAVPVKFGLGGNYGLALFDAGSPKSQAISCGAAVIDDIEETSTAGGSSLSYDTASGRYNYVWKTDKAWAGTCRQLILNFNDGSVQRANFKFK